MSEKIRTVRAIGILEGLLERFKESSQNSAAAIQHPTTRSENERLAVEMQREGRREAWEDAARAVREVLERDGAFLETREAEHRVLRREIATLREVEKRLEAEKADSERRLDVEKRAHSLTMDQLTTTRQDARDLREERDGRGERIKQLSGDLERATAEKGEAVRLLEVANRERDKARDRAAELRIEFDAAVVQFRAAEATAENLRAENNRLLRHIGESIRREPLLGIGRELRRRAADHNAVAAKLKCAALLVLEVALGSWSAETRDLARLHGGNGVEGPDKLEAWERKASGPGGASDAPRIRRVEPVMLSVAAQREIARARVEIAEIEASRFLDAMAIRKVLSTLLDALPKPGEPAIWLNDRSGGDRLEDRIAKLEEGVNPIITGLNLLEARVDVLEATDPSAARVEIAGSIADRLSRLEAFADTFQKDNADRWKRLDQHAERIVKIEARLDEEAEHRRTLAECVNALQKQARERMEALPVVVRGAP